MKKISILIFALFLQLFPIGEARAVDSLVIGAYEAAPICSSAPVSSLYAIRFYAGTSANITKLVIKYSANIAANTPSIKIYTDSSGLLGSTIGTLSYSSVAASGSYFLVTYVGSVATTGSNYYWMEQNQVGSSVAASHCYGTSSISSANSWNLVASGGYWRWRLPANVGFDYYHWSVDLYIGAGDSTPPTFSSSSTFSAAENTSTSSTVATIRVSESSTVTISSGADASLFNIYKSDTDTAIIKFKVSPNYEAPTDSGGNNVFDLTLSAADAAGNVGTQSITITVTDVTETSTFSSLLLAGSATTATYRGAVLITAVVSVPSKVTFKVNGKVLPGCKGRLTVESTPNYISTCSWRPSNRGLITLTAISVPTASGITGANSSPVSIRVGNRTGLR